MRVFELNRKQILSDSAWPVKAFHARIDIEIDFGESEVPTKAARRFALDALRELLAESSEEDFASLSRPLHRTAPEPTPETATVENKRTWAKPEDMDMRVIKSAHRVVAEVAKRGVSGREVLASELVGAIGLSAPTLGRLLREGEEANAYLSQYVRVVPSGRTKALDLTPEGRLLASQIRAGVIPA